MGLAGRKQKQRIPNDPRNLTWADDASRFGQSYLSKFGWDPSKGLGISGDGRTSHIKVTQKLDMLGIGAAHQQDPNGIAWKQNKDFENLLKRLNDSAEKEARENGVKEKEEGVDAEKVVQTTKEAEEERKRKNEGGDEGQKSKKKRKRSKSSTDDEPTLAAAAVQESVEDRVSVINPPAKPLIHRHRAHRARAIASKSIASKSATAIAEILGIAPSASASTTPSTSDTPHGTLTPTNDDLAIENLTTSTKSVADYFKERLMSKARTGPTAVAATSRQHEEEDVPSWDAPRGGLGSAKSQAATQHFTETRTETVGLSKFTSFVSSTILSATSLVTTDTPGDSVPEQPTQEVESGLSPRKSRKKSKTKAKVIDPASEAPDPDADNGPIALDSNLETCKSKHKNSGRPEDDPTDGVQTKGEGRRKKAEGKAKKHRIDR